MAELIEMLFGVWTLEGPSNNVLDGVQIRTHEGAIMRMKGASPGHARICPGMSWDIGVTELDVGAKILTMSVPFSHSDSAGGGRTGTVRMLTVVY